MSNISRRTFVGALTAIPFSVWFEKYGSAQTPKIRYNAYSLQGKTMLAIYKTAVGTMMTSIPTGDPLWWVFQWYTHAVKQPPGKASEINSIYPNPSPFKPMAQAVWNTCQAHFNAANEPWFLPWHRMYVYFFERIIRKVSGKPNFTLPYWNYSAAGATHGKIPPQFRLSGSPLFVQKRNVHTPNNQFANVNAGQAIDAFAPGILSTSALSECTYLPVGQTDPGFNMGLDGGLHGNVHVFVGNGQNMGSIPWAAGDPVFWMHHCNIDRLWASWNAVGRTNPTNDPNWMSKTFQFVDENKNLVTVPVKDFVSIAHLGYKYDHLEPVPACPPVQLQAAAEKVHATSNAVVLSGAPQQARLAPSGAAAESFATRVKALKPGHHVYLVVKDLKADAQPETIYNLYLDMPPETPPARRAGYFVGRIHFFDAVAHEDHEAGAAGKFFSFDVTRVAKNLVAQKKLSPTPAITIIPAGEPAAEARPVVGDIRLIEK